MFILLSYSKKDLSTTETKELNEKLLQLEGSDMCKRRLNDNTVLLEVGSDLNNLIYDLCSCRDLGLCNVEISFFDTEPSFFKIL